eukprot:gene9765-10764_t
MDAATAHSPLNITTASCGVNSDNANVNDAATTNVDINDTSAVATKDFYNVHATQHRDSCRSGRLAAEESFISNNSLENLDVPLWCIGELLEDKFRNDKETFLVLSHRLGKVYLYRFNRARSLWIFGPKNPVRKMAVMLITNQFFEFFVVLTILINCVMLALSDTPEEAEYVFTAIYTVEMVLKILAKGLILHKYAYLRDPWNWLDFVVVCLGYITLTPHVSNFTGIRTFRVLRALRTISAVEGLKTMVNALLKSMRLLSDVLALTTFFICVFALLGLQLFSGYLLNKCVRMPGNITEPYDVYVRNSDNWYSVDGVFEVCGNFSTSRRCPTNYTCLPDIGDNPNYGYTSFDHFGWALLTSFQLVTMDFWENAYFNVISAAGSWSVFYFMVVIFFGSFYLINLVLAVVAVSYEQEAENVANREKFYEQLKSIASSYSLHNKFTPKLLFDPPKGDEDDDCKLPDVVVFDPNQKSIFRSIRRQRRRRAPEKQGLSQKIFQSSIHPTSNNDVTLMLEDSKNTQALQNPSSKESITAVNGHQKTIQRQASLSKQPSVAKQTSFQSDTATASSSTSHVKNFSSTESDSTLPWRPYQDKDESSLTTWNRIRLKIFATVSNSFFEFAVTVFIFLNTIVLSLEYHGMNPLLKQALVVLNHVFTSVFLTEMILKLIAYGLKRYLRSRWNLFDGLVVIISMVDLLVELVTHSDNSSLSILRSFRLLRVLKLAQSWSTMRSLLGAIGRSINAMGHLTLILAIIIYMFALVGIQLFKNKYEASKFPDGKIPRWNFKDFGHSFMMLFRILCGEWIEPLYDCMKASSTWSIAFFVLALIVGNFLVLNLFLALLLSSLADEAFEQELKRRERQRKRQMRSLRKILRLQTVLKKISGKGQSDDVQEKSGADKLASVARRALRKKSIRHCDSEKEKITKCIVANKLEVVEEEVTRPNSEKNSSYQPKPCLPFCCPYSDGQNLGQTFWSRRSKDILLLRTIVKKFVDNKWFDNGILLLILASSIVLVFEDIHLPTKPTLKAFLGGLNVFFCVVFFIEFVLKAVGWGIYTYIRNPWNCLDLFIVCISIASVISAFTNSQGSLNALRSVRTFRALRPLRAISRWEGIRIVVNSLFQAIPSIGNVLLVCIMFWLIFSIMGVQFFGGMFFKCIDSSGALLPASVIPDRNACLAFNYEWVNSKVNFDNSLNGFLALLQVATFEGWMEVMNDAVDAAGINKQPSPEANFYAYFYFVIFIIIGSFFVLNLFISVIIDNFYRMKKRYDDGCDFSLFLTSNQKHWFNTLRKAVTKKPKKSLHRPTRKWQSKLFDFVLSVKFETVVMLLILLNMFMMMISHYKQSAAITEALNILSSMFTIEAVLKLLAFRWQYFHSPWNDFDLIILLLSIAGIILEYLSVNLLVTPNILRVIRVLRIGRLLRFFKAADGIRRQLVALIISLPALFNIGTLLFLALFIYAIIGMGSFGHVKKQGAINDVVNFETFGQSMLVLFRLATSAGWNEVLDSLMIQPPDCDPNYAGLPNGNCGKPLGAVLYMVTFIFFTFMVIVNMYIAVILENFNQATEDEEIGVTDDDIQMFYTTWQSFDPKATQYVEYHQLSDFLDKLCPPLQIPKPNIEICWKLDIPIKDGDKIHCADVLLATLKYNVMSEVGESDAETLKYISETIETKLETAFPIRAKDVTMCTTGLKMQQVHAATTIQRMFKDWKARKILLLQGKQQSEFELNAFPRNDDDDDDEWTGPRDTQRQQRRRLTPLQIHVTESPASMDR